MYFLCFNEAWMWEYVWAFLTLRLSNEVNAIDINTITGVFPHLQWCVWGGLSVIGKHSTADIRRSIIVGGLTQTCGSNGLGSGRPHHITTKKSLYGLACLVGAVKPSHPILPSLLPSLPPSTVFSVSFAISITPINGFLALKLASGGSAPL